MNYQDSGVNLHDQNMFNAKLCGKMPWLGGYGGAMPITEEDYLISSTDGVGTKIKLYNDYKDLDGVSIKNLGIDLVAMVMNDIVCTGAKPLFFNDYLAVNSLESVEALDLIDGINEGLELCGDNVPLMGGETAIMSDMYKVGDFDLAGFGVGICKQDNFIDGTDIVSGDVMLGLASSGFHSNGYTLIRKVVETFEEEVMSVLESSKGSPGNFPPTLIQDLLKPTRIYVKSVLEVLHLHKGSVHGIAHITGGGRNNVNRLLGESINLKPMWNNNNDAFRQEEFHWIQQYGNISDEEMRRVFNDGIGMVLIVERDDASKVISLLEALGEEVYEVGSIVDRLNAEQLDELNKTIENRH
jgi:phosphoribosylformylglycinamidine cyclo-ligase